MRQCKKTAGGGGGGTTHKPSWTLSDQLEEAPNI